MSKLSIIHNLYKRNEFVKESVRLNLIALKDANIDFQYILFNDNGDKDIWEDIIDYILYAVQSPISDDEEYQNGLQIIELIKEQMYD